MMKWLVLFLAFMALTSVIPAAVVGEAVNGFSVDSSAPWTATATQLAEPNSTSLVVLVLVNSAVYEGVKASLEQYSRDLENFGYEHVIILNWSEPNPAKIREMLQQYYLNSTLAGALLVGDIPAAEYEMFTEWDYERFPMDLYYMDLDGNWTDIDRDGVLDRHSGEVAPDVWIGRIKTSNLGGDEISLINKYFERNHRYRTGSLYAQRRGLLYIDDDWIDFRSMDSYSLGLLYDDMTVVTERTTTNASDYKSRLKEGYEWVHLRSHGDWNGHSFRVPGGDGGVINSTEYEEINPYALFYQLFVCSAARFTEPNYLAGEAVFNTNYGLLAVGSTKVGGMLLFWTFYEAIARGRSLGDAFKEWFIRWGEGKVTVSSHFVGRKWFYGLALIGDPTLRLRWLGEKEIAELQRQEEEVIDDLPLVQELRQQVLDSEANYSSLSNDYDDLKDFYSALQSNHKGLTAQLTDLRNLLYFFLFATTILAVANVYYAKSKQKSKSVGSG